MARYALRRIGLLVPTLVGLAVLLFIWVRALPGGPARGLLPPQADQSLIDQINATYGFDEPLWKQFVTYISALARGDFGSSIKTNEPVLSSFFDKIPATIELSAVALVFAIAIGIPLGYWAGRRQGSWVDTTIVSGSLIGVVTPVFFLALLLKYVFALQLGVFYTQGREQSRVGNDHPTGFYLLDGLITGNPGASLDAFLHLVLPAIALARSRSRSSSGSPAPPSRRSCTRTTSAPPRPRGSRPGS